MTNEEKIKKEYKENIWRRTRCKIDSVCQSMAKNNNHLIIYLSMFVFIILCCYICTPAYSQQQSEPPTVTKFIGSQDFAKYKRLAVLPFADAPSAPQSGQIAQGIAVTTFAKAGFQVVEGSNELDKQAMATSGQINSKQSARLGKLLGVNAIVVGAVGQYQTVNRHTEPYYETIYNPCDEKCQNDIMLYSGLQGADAALELMKERNKPRYILRQGQSWTESNVSVSLRVIDVKTGSVIYSASGYYKKGYTNPPQELLEFILQALVNEWAAD